jgi:hypothetical protein
MSLLRVSEIPRSKRAQRSHRNEIKQPLLDSAAPLVRMDIPSVLRVPTQIAPAQPDNPGKPRRKPKLHKKTKTKKPKRKKRQSIGIGHNGGPPLREWLATDDDAVFTFREWCAINSLSERQGRRILTAPGGPVVTQLTERRIGITRRNNRLWLESRARTR